MQRIFTAYSCNIILTLRNQFIWRVRISDNINLIGDGLGILRAFKMWWTCQFIPLVIEFTIQKHREIQGCSDLIMSNGNILHN